MSILNKKTDQELIHIYLDGKETALAALLERYKSKIYTSIYMKVKDEYLAEDIFQETFIKVINTLKGGKYNDEGKFLPWVMRIAHNMIIDHFRKEKRAPSIVNTEGFDIFDVLDFSDENVESKMLREQRDIDLKRMIQKLPDDQKRY
ncbi:RNA polymerase sigma factor [Sphingobacterium sp. IITKGP-BTPF85]|uniref:RNA polymerase sigma factor n=1 Tax=Sphingobacterium sp. IITKGP-BTPF85 TaxID=1338009 RepID=UPI0003FA669D|nr:RNA polymerase sigma factor [Sphingobacterium sp. IITKGP-BTPF85]KKX52300.1 RNA polymerase subunit sigma-24 [Sphingobacterium sp. IITKGP-BTPF85]